MWHFLWSPLILLSNRSKFGTVIIICSCILREIEINKNFHSLRSISVCDPLILGFPISLNFRCGSKNLDHNLWSRDLVICNFCYWIKKRCDLLILICIKIVIFDFDPSKIVILNLRIKNCVWSMILILAKSVILWSWDFCKWILNCEKSIKWLDI